MTPKRGLGRGLDALLSENGDGDFPEMHDGEEREPVGTADRDSVVALSLDRLRASPGQPRKSFDDDGLRELADSIAEHGVIQPIIVCESGDGSYDIIAGERRTRAARLAGLSEIPAIVRDYSDRGRLEVSLVENIQRSDLNPMEEALAYKNLMDFSGLSQEELAARVGKNRSTVANSLRLLRLSPEMRASLETGLLSPGHARALLSVTDPAKRDSLFREISGGGSSVREAEKRAAAMNARTESGEAPQKPAEAEKRPPELVEMEERFIERLGTKVSIEGGIGRGRIRIEYYSEDDLDRLYGILGGETGNSGQGQTAGT